jgi:signal transduction histidine kinase
MPDMMERYLQEIVEHSLGTDPENMLRTSLQACIEISGADGGSILGEEGPHLQFLFSDVTELIGTKVPFDSIAGISVNRSLVVYTYAPKDPRHFEEIDRHTRHTTKYLLSIPIPSIHRSAEKYKRAKNAGALQLLFNENIFPDTIVDKHPKEFEIDSFKDDELYRTRLHRIFWLLPIIAFGMEVLTLRQTSYQAIHELKNKLISSLSWLEYLRKDLLELSPELLESPNIREDFDLAESSVREGAELARTYLQLANIYTPEFAPSNINDILLDTTPSVKAFADEIHLEHLHVSHNLAKHVPTLNLDPRRLKMAFFNLCKNAVEACVEHSVHAPILKITTEATDDHVDIIITDNGPGMPPEISENLFVPFKTKKEGGTGLGLTIAKKIIDIHGGTINCRTGKEGTQFLIRL